MAKTFRAKTILNSDDVNISKDNKNIEVHNVWSEPIKNKKGQIISFTTHHKIRRYPNNKKNRTKAESLIGKLRRRDY